MIKLRHKLAKKLIPKTYGLFDSLVELKSNRPRPSTLILKNFFEDEKINGCELGVFDGKNAISLLEHLNFNELHLIDAWDLLDDDYENEMKFAKRDKLNLNNLFSQYLPLRKKKYFDRKIDRNEQEKHVRSLFTKNQNVYIHKTFTRDPIFTDNYFDFVYFDASKMYNNVIRDLHDWISKIKTGGFACGHDTQILDVLQAVIDYSFENNFKLQIHHPDWIFQKS